jgi:uracil-DNA glycosylase family 4
MRPKYLPTQHAVIADSQDCLMPHPNPQSQLDSLHAELRHCRRCVEAGYFIGSAPVFSGPASARVMVVGQAPAKVETGEQGRPFGLRRGGQRSLLWDWLAQAGWSEVEFREQQYLSAITKCYPGKSTGGRGDRVPTAVERELCRSWREQELAIVQPLIIVPIGRVAIEQFLPELKGQPLESFIGQTFGRDGAVIVPLPHPSGVSRWLNAPENRVRVEQALTRLKELKERFGI